MKDKNSEKNKKVLDFALPFSILVFCFFIFAVPHADAAILSLNPGIGTFTVGSTFNLSIILDTKSIAVNTIETELFFPSNKLQLASPSVGQSIIQLWPTPPVFSNRDGRIYFIGGIPSPGINTSQGVVLTLTFRVIAPGDAEIRFGEKTRVLANDGKGTDVLNQQPSAFFTFQVPLSQGPAISSPTHYDQERWYRDQNPVFLWSKNQFADTYSYSIDRDPSGFPDTTAEGSSPTASFQNLDNGISYFHLREKAGGVWGGVSHYVVKIDNIAPASFKVNASPSLRTTNKNPIFRFFTTDSLSGFDHFEMKFIPLSEEFTGEALFFEVSSPYQASNLNLGRYQVVVRAFDKAGNIRDETVTANIVGSLAQFLNPEGIDLVFLFLPWPQVIAIGGAVFLIILIILAILWLKHRHHLPHAFREDILRLLHLIGKQPPKITVHLSGNNNLK